MTIDEAIKHAEEVSEEKHKADNLKQCKDYGNPKSTITSGVFECEKCADEHRQLAEWLKDYKRLLEQEPCEDCVSRKRLMDNYNGVETPVGYRKVVDFEVIKNMQPVRPTRKKGKWIAKENIKGLEKFYECSNCGNHCLYEYVEIGFQNAKTNYCPNCGAEMDCVTLDDVFDNTVKEKTFEESVLIQLIRDMPKEMGVLYIQSFQQQHGPFTDEAAEIIREYLSKE